MHIRALNRRNGAARRMGGSHRTRADGLSFGPHAGTPGIGRDLTHRSRLPRRRCGFPTSAHAWCSLLVLFVLIVVMAGFAAVLALALLPIFGAAGEGVNAFRERLDAAGVGRAGIPHLPQSSTIFAADGKTVLAQIYLDENRRYVRIGKIAPVAQQAVVAIEDDSFYQHGALNFPSLMRAAITNLIAGDIEQGGSTLTQQLVKNVLIDSPQQTFARKFQEAALAIRVERKYSKDHILELYMNEAYYGNGAYGIQTAAETYFHTTARNLAPASGPARRGDPGPGTYDPVAHPDAATARRNLVLERMSELGVIDPADAAKAQAKPLGIAKDAGEFKEKVEPFFVYYIRNLILDNADGQFDAFGRRRIERVHTLYQGGLNIYTSLEPSWQEYAQEAVDASPAIHPGRNSPDVSLVSVRATDGAIRAMLSGKNYDRDQYDLVWRGTRQVGSAFKPFTLTAAFEQGFPPGKVYSSRSPLCNLEGWRSASGCVSNAEGGGDSGYLDLWSATQDSVNVVFAQLALDVGPEHIVDAAHRMGITVPWTRFPRSRSASRRSRRWTWRPRSGRSRTTANAATHGPSGGWSSRTSRKTPRRTSASCTSTSQSASR